MADESPDRAQTKIAKSQPRRFHRWFRFSLASLFVCVTVFCMGLANVANRARRQAPALALASETGATVRYYGDTLHQDGAAQYSVIPPGPKWLTRRNATHWWYSIQGIHFRPGIMGDWGDSPPASRPTDDDLARLRDMPALQFLCLKYTSVGDRGCEHIATCRTLLDLDLSCNQVTGEGLSHLVRLRELQRIDLTGCPINNEGLEHVSRLEKLETLELGSTRVDDAGLACLAELPHLKTLRLSYTKITNQGLAHFRNHPTLEEIDLGGTVVDDEGMKDLETIPNLETIHLHRTRVSYPTIWRLRTAHPSWKVLSF